MSKGIFKSIVKSLKGQVISECHFGVLNFPKKQRNFVRISALGQIKQISDYLSFYVVKCLYFFNLTHFKENPYKYFVATAS